MYFRTILFIYASIDVDLAEEAFARIYKPEFVTINWEDKKELLQNGYIDCVWSSFTMYDRENEYKWAGPYMQSNQVIAVNVNSDIYSIDDLEDILKTYAQDSYLHGLIVLDMEGNIVAENDGTTVLTHEFINLAELTQNIVTIIVDRAMESGIIWNYEHGKSKILYPYIYGNCIKYNRPGGMITTVVEGWDDSDGVCVYRWTISDTGRGMSPEFLKHIFDPFAQKSTPEPERA